MTVFTHTPRLPDVGHIGGQQRNFIKSDACEGAAVVRFEYEDKAELRITLFGELNEYSRATIVTLLDANHCRELARALVDAAHDLEAFPASPKVAA